MDLSTFHMGCDEAGRGPLIGRIYASAVILDPSIPVHSYTQDSKKLTPKKRDIARKYIEKTAIEYTVSYIEPDEIDKINIRQANIKVFNNVIRNLKTKVEHVYIDGNDFVPDEKCPYMKSHIDTVIKGDSKVHAISAASILAKEYHDDYIKELCLFYPELNEKYDLLANKGYGTKKHIAGIKKHGVSPFHRYTFCKKFI